MVDQFPPEVQVKLGFYVYRLIDPRSGQTFYVGKGRGNRIFAHAKGVTSEISDELEDAESLKIQTIREIQRSGLEPLHVVHRHGLDEETAFDFKAEGTSRRPGNQGHCEVGVCSGAATAPHETETAGASAREMPRDGLLTATKKTAPRNGAVF